MSLLRFLFRRSKQSSDEALQKRRIDLFQRQLNTFKTAPQEKRIPNQTLSFKEIEDEVNGKIKDFQHYVEYVKEASLKLEELTKMLKSSEISEETYKLLMGELGDQLSISVKEIYKLRKALELDRAKAKLEWAKEKIGMNSARANPPEMRIIYEDEYGRRFSPSYKWEEIISKIDKVLSSLTIMEEVSILEQYLSFIKDFVEGGRSSEAKLKEGKELCERRLNLISDEWSSIRRSKMDEMMNLDIKASEIEDKIKEMEVRFAVGEIDQNTYESSMGALQRSLKNVKKEISDIRNTIDNVDMKIFRCQELVRDIL